MKNTNNFQKAKVQPHVLLSICLIFCQFQPGVAYLSVAYKKTCAAVIVILIVSCDCDFVL